MKCRDSVGFPLSVAVESALPMWQESLITAVTLALTLSVLPTIRDPHARVPLQTSGLTTVGLLVKAITFGSLGMVGPAVGATVSCGTWALLAYLRSGVRERLRASPTSATDSPVADYTVADD